jgi:hypothetical protein
MPTKKAPVSPKKGTLSQELRLAYAWKKGGKEALREELTKMHPEKAAKIPSSATPKTKT